MSIRETLDQNKNSIELALINFLKSKLNIQSDVDEKVLTKISSVMAKEIPFSSYLELGYALDEFDEDDINSEASEDATDKIFKILGKNKLRVSNALNKFREEQQKNSGEAKLVGEIIKYISALRETTRIRFFSSEALNEDNSPSYHYTARVPASLIEKIVEWLSERNMSHFVNDSDEMVIECGDRDSLYAFDKYLMKTIQQEHLMVDFKISEGKKRPQDMTSYDLARTVKPRFDQTQMPKSGAFDKDTKGAIRKKNPNDRRAMKHKNRAYETAEKPVLDEAVMGMTGVPSINRLQMLAGVPVMPVQSSEPTEKAKLQTEAYLVALDHLAVIRELLGEMTEYEHDEICESIETILSDLK